MSIRLGILKNNKVKTIFAYYPNDIKQVINIIKDHYNKSVIIEDLIELGDIHSLRKDSLLTLYFSRDKGDDYEGCKPIIEEASNLQDINTDISPVDYYLIWTNKWNICPAYTKDWKSLTKFIKTLK